MWSDEINKKIQETEGSNNPAYNDKAWINMELLLDKHLPLKKKRRIFIFLMLLILLTGSIFFYILQNGDKKNKPVIEQINIPVQSSPSADKLPDNTNNITVPSQRPPAQLKPDGAISQKQVRKIKSQDPTAFRINSDTKKIKQGQRREDYDQSQPFWRKKTVKKTEDPPANFLSEKPVELNNPRSVDKVGADKTLNPFPIDSLATQKAVVTMDKKQEDTVQTKTTKTPIKEEKPKVSAASKLSLNLSFGPDISAVGIDKPGKLDMQYGIGVSYALSERFSIRTGFFAGHKKYTADSADYHSPYTIANLQNIDANCLVYEIPLTLVYNFSATKKHNWFISGGVSSYLMKEETYEYYYKNSWGQPQSYSHTYRNENSHLFSVINISGGYQYHFTDRFSIIGEPYVKIPASGIGVGKIKLNSAGILFTLRFKPFLKAK